MRLAAGRLAGFLAGAALLIPGGAGAADPSPLPVVTLPPVTVVGTADNPAGGPAVLSGEILRQLPPGDGSVSEALRVLPDVQLSETYRSSLTAGEILPPRYSIAGGKAFQNTFLVDGMPADSLLDPAADNPLVFNDAPGHPQLVFPNVDLIGRLSVYDSNVPAEYGGFTGGVVTTEIRDPAPRFGGRLHYQTTRDEWTRFHLADEDRAEFESSRTVRFQPRFEKHRAGASLDLPVRENLGILGAYEINHSRIPLRHFDTSREQTRQLENIVLKGVGRVGTDLEMEGLLLYTPYRAELFIADALDSGFTVRGGGGELQLTARRLLETGEIRLRLGAARSENTREAPPHWRLWKITASRNWGTEAGVPYSAEGGYGTIEKTQEDLFADLALIVEPAATVSWRHRLQTGVEVVRTEGSFDRKDTTFIYNGLDFSVGVICNDAEFDCVDGEQYFNQRLVYPAAKVEATISRFAWYLDNQLSAGRFGLRPGLRLAYDDFMQNLDAAPRLAATFDAFGDGGTVVTAGANRYYGQALLTYKLREARQPYTLQFRSLDQSIPGEWENNVSLERHQARFSRLQTPYSDELVAGVDQTLFGGRLSLKYVQREGHDEFAREYGPVQADGVRYYTLTNRGRSRHRSYRVTWERQWPRHFVSANATWQESTTTNEDYDDALEPESASDRIWFEGKLIHRAELPRRDYNRPVTLNFTWVAGLPYGLSFTNVAQYRGGYRAIQLTSEKRETPTGERRRNPLTGEEIIEYADVYEERDYGDAVIVDWRISWETVVLKGQTVRLNLDIYNVFDVRAPAGPDARSYQLGRQFWAGAELFF